jgi:LSD1 subclass zinc finger protein
MDLDGCIYKLRYLI